MISSTIVVAALSLAGTFSYSSMADQFTINGKVLDVKGESVCFATIVARDSVGTVIAGVSTDENGTFTFNAPAGEYSVCVSLIGYKDTILTVKVSGESLTMPAIILAEDTEVLNAATVQAVMPKVKLTGEGLQTSVKGTVLESAGTAEDVLAKTPGIIKGQNGLEVIGRGAPAIYINGRKMTDSSEIQRIMSNEIQSIEVINNPGAQYDAQVRAVVRIKTVRKQGEGFGFNLDLTDEQSLKIASFNDPHANVNANYRAGSVDIFAGVNAYRYSTRQESEITGQNMLTPRFFQDGSVTNDFIQKSATVNGGVNWQISDNHSIGFKVSRQGHFATDQHEEMSEKVWKENFMMDRELIDDLFTVNDIHIGDIKPRTYTANVYYNGQAGKLGIDLNLDYFGSKSSEASHATETSIIEDRTIDCTSNNRSSMYAGKLILSYPVWKGMFQFGTEDVFTKHDEDYSITGAPIPSSDSKVNEKNLAAFAAYAFALPKLGQFNAGLRYEHVDYSYDVTGGFSKENINRKYDNFFPTLSYAGMIGKVQTMLSYGVKTSRPPFSYLSDAIRYNNKYTLQSGNAAIQPSFVTQLSATAVWKFMTFMVDYQKSKDTMITWSKRYLDEKGQPSDGIIITMPKNLSDPIRTLTGVINATPTIGIWTLNMTAVIEQQWLKLNYTDELDSSLNRVIAFDDKPLFITQMFNYFRIKGGWQFELGGEYHSTGYSQNIEIINRYFDLTAAVQKSLLKDGSLVLRLSGSDLVGLGHSDAFADFGAHIMTQTSLFDTQRLKLSVRYNFNTANNKYKGSGAGSDVKKRM